MSAIELRFEAVECLKRVLTLETEARSLRAQAAAATKEADRLEASGRLYRSGLTIARVQHPEPRGACVMPDQKPTDHTKADEQKPTPIPGVDPLKHEPPSFKGGERDEPAFDPQMPAGNG